MNALIEKWFGPGRRDVLTGVAAGPTGGLNDATEGRAIAEEDYMKKPPTFPPTVLFRIRRVLLMTSMSR